MTTPVIPFGQVEPSIAALECTVSGTTVTTPDGSTVPLDRCDWLTVAPCGCISGIVLAVCGEMVLNNAKAALREVSDGAKDAASREKLGFRMLLIQHADYGRVVLPMWRDHDCAHDPKWGYTNPTKVVGGVTFTRHSAAEWRCGDRKVEKIGSYWYLTDPDAPAGFVYLDRLITRALPRAAELITKAAAEAQVTP